MNPFDNLSSSPLQFSQSSHLGEVPRSGGEGPLFIITGATGSMGKVAVRKMAEEGYPVIMACRNLKKGETVRQEILSELPDATIELHELQLASRDSVRKFVESLGDRKIAGLFNNAGIMNRNYALAESGIENTMEVNYLANALLTILLTPLFENGARIVNMVSLTTKFAHLDINWPQWGREHFSQLGTYGSSKLAFLYFSIAYARRNPQLRVNVADPGIVDSSMIHMDRWFDPLADIFFRPFISSPEKGVRPALAALHTDDSLRYFVGKKSKSIPERFLNSQLVDKLWLQLHEMLGLGM